MVLRWLLRHAYVTTTHTYGQTISFISPHTPARWLVVRYVRLGVWLGLEYHGVQAWQRGAAVPPRCSQQGAGASRPRWLPGAGNRAAPSTAAIARCRAARRGSRRERSHPSAPCAVAQARVAGAWPPLLPHRRQMQRLDEEHVAQLPGIHLNRRPGIERAPQPLLRRLVPRGDDPRRHLPGPARLRRGHLQRLHATP